ncbi:MAG: hypothetical protein L3J81_04180, partial [Thermoplasmata archaeon]|nr:hypothetical protein [Thermoplasmata archaeon]
VDDRLRRVVEALGQHPGAGYYHNGQAFVDGQGGPLDTATSLRRLRRYTGAPVGPLREVRVETLRRHPSALARWGAFFNNSSVAIRRSALLDCLPELRSTARLADSFMFYAALASGEPLLFDASPTTQYRIHAGNRSRGTQAAAAPGIVQPSETRAGRMASVEAMRAMARRRGAPWLGTWLDRDAAYLDLLEGFREGETDRTLTVRRTLRLARYLGYADPLMNLVLAITGCGLAVSPGLAHRSYWSPAPEVPGAPPSGPGS